MAREVGLAARADRVEQLAARAVQQVVQLEATPERAVVEVRPVALEDRLLTQAAREAA